MGKNLEKISETFQATIAGAFFVSVLTPLTLGALNAYSKNKINLDEATLYGALFGAVVGAGSGFLSKYNN